jgi:hypothetical protein
MDLLHDPSTISNIRTAAITGKSARNRLGLQATSRLGMVQLLKGPKDVAIVGPHYTVRNRACGQLARLVTQADGALGVFEWPPHCMLCLALFLRNACCLVWDTPFS